MLCGYKEKNYKSKKFLSHPDQLKKRAQNVEEVQVVEKPYM